MNAHECSNLNLNRVKIKTQRKFEIENSEEKRFNFQRDTKDKNCSRLGLR